MDEKFSRTEMLIGNDGMEKLADAKVAVFGLGGVGSFVCEGLARSGVGNFILVDFDKVDESNINRQLIATVNTVGKYKVDLMKERIFEINPDANVEVYKEFYLADSETDIITEDLSYVVDCVDTILAKIAIICSCDALKVPVISSMGTGNKLDATMFEVADIYETSVCPLARIMKKDLKKRNIKKLKVVYSKEHAINTNDHPINKDLKYKVKGSVSFVPSVAGLIIAGEVIKDIAGK
ncbi:tRNA threonylcarbamoyladenosine dehydratase [Methanobrevibacter millerae]|uniref:tRNA A37 threonylcarbamoyladenosine dehydratase n=1 Tax=Methanobrevibacter millerae TaxID=230361 RepID=A0A1G5WYK5_9EURY|nr:tRNA threonylcarbamoyladenosine dehydratase [Methanobrevibacter millerae]SDA63050.1 tRNA A37 threonylcarbamoyladenosine dehydratase [Methanobrevibacter millerae]